MKKYHAMLSAIEGYFSIETAGSQDDAANFERRMSSDPARAKRMREDILASLSDADFSWRLALWNEESHIEEFEAEQDARAYVANEILPAVERACAATQ